MELIKILSDKCTLCYTCIKVCPVKAIHLSEDINSLVIDHQRCIGCGNCYVRCTHKAIEYHKSYKVVSELLKQNKKCVAIVDPSIASEFPDILDYRNFVSMIRALGFSFVNEISFGADLVAIKYKNILDNFKGKYYVSSNCPPIYKYIEKYLPNIIDSLVPVVSPMLATAMVVRELHGEDALVVAISPCIAQKMEILDFKNLVDEVISFEELRLLFEENNIYENSVEFSEFDEPIGLKGSLYPIPTGILDAADINYASIENRILSLNGPDNFLQNINDFANINEIKHHLNIFYCSGCLSGPGCKNNKSYTYNHSLVVNYTKKRLGINDKQQCLDNINKFSGINLTRSFKIDDQRQKNTDEKKIKEILKLINQENCTEQGCKSCGYKNCYDFANAVANGYVTYDFCTNYSLKNRKEYISKISEISDKLDDTKKSLDLAEARLRVECEGMENSMFIVKMIMENLPLSMLIVDDNLKIIQSNQTFIDLIGQEAREINEIIPGLEGADIKTLLPLQVCNFFNYVTEKGEAVENKDIEIEDKLITISVFPIRRGKINGAIFKNLYQSEIRRDELIHRISDVIEKNLAMVQQIGFLLGEGAAETERMLNSIINSFGKENPNK